MMKFTKSTVFYWTLMFTWISAWSTHTSGGEIYYRWSSDSTYEVTVTFFRHCTGFTATSPSSVLLNVSSDSLNISFNKTLVKLSIVGSNVPPLVPVNVYNCFPNSTLCVEEYVYRGYVTMPARARDWIFSYEVCCRPTELDNLANSYFRIEGGMNNLDFQDSIHKNISPIWHTRRPNITGHPYDTILNYPVWNVCEWKDYNIDQSAVEYQGDSLVYELLYFHRDSFFVYNNLLTYLTPYSDTFVIPFDTSKPLSIDAHTGIVQYSPVTPANASSLGGLRLFQFAIKATEYRYDSFPVGNSKVWQARPISYLIRNIQTITTDSSLCPQPSPFGTSAYVPTHLNCQDSLIEFDLKKNIMCSTLDPDASCFLMVDTLSKDTVALDSAWIRDCYRTGEGYKVSVRPKVHLPKGVYWLTFVTGSDSNTAVSSCQIEIPPFKDTLLIIRDSVPVGVMRGNHVSGNIYNTWIELPCYANSMYVNLSENVLCSSIAPDNSDFLLVNKSVTPNAVVSISKVLKQVCSDGNTSGLQILTTYPLLSGSYTLYLVKGSDGNTLLTECLEEWPTMLIPVVVKGIEVSLGPDLVYCEGIPFSTVLTTGNYYYSYHWSTGSISRTIIVSSPGTYWVKVGAPNGCYGSDTLVIREVNCTGIEEKRNRGFTVFPNPFSDEVVISHPYIESADVEVFDIYGRSVLFKPAFTRNFSAGLYYIRLRTVDGSVTYKMLKE